jgi:xanthine dehydrogenase molybdopterin-binding subunit B
VDTSKALSIPGVKDFIDHNDIPGQKTWGSVVQDQELFSSGEVLRFRQLFFKAYDLNIIVLKYV